MRNMILLLIPLLAVASVSQAATEQDKQQAIDDGLAWLAGTQQAGGQWLDNNGASGYVGATASAALAFIEEGYLPGNDVVIGGTNYGNVVGRAVNYIYSYATYDNGSGHPADNVYFRSADGNYDRSVYTTGLVAPVIYALGKANPDATITSSNAQLNGKTYRQVMQSTVNWVVWGQDDDGGWRYHPNYGKSDNSTAQWGALPLLYGQDWGLTIPASTYTALEGYVNYIQNPISGGSGYYTPTGIGDGYNITPSASKTGGLLLELAAIGAPLTDSRVQAALGFINAGWNDGPSGLWYGDLNHPYAMWAVYKGLEVYGLTSMDAGPDGILGTADDYQIGFGMSNAPGGFTIGQDWASDTSPVGDWYSHYSDYLVSIQNTNGSWNGYQYWTGALATGWYINILNATGAPEPVIPAPAAVVLGALGLSAAGWRLRRRGEL